MARAVQVILTNETEDHQFSEWIEPLKDYPNGDDTTMGEIYRHAQDEYGRCTSKVYVDRAGASPLHVGWFFVSKQKYDDTNEPYIRGAWVSVGEWHRAVREHITFTEEGLT